VPQHCCSRPRPTPRVSRVPSANRSRCRRATSHAVARRGPQADRCHTRCPDLYINSWRIANLGRIWMQLGSAEGSAIRPKGVGSRISNVNSPGLSQRSLCGTLAGILTISPWPSHSCGLRPALKVKPAARWRQPRVVILVWPGQHNLRRPASHRYRGDIHVVRHRGLVNDSLAVRTGIKDWHHTSLVRQAPRGL